MASVIEPGLTSWVSVPRDSDFPIQNLPYGVMQRSDGTTAVGVAIGEQVLDLAVVHEAGLFRRTAIAGDNVFARNTLNDFMALGRAVWREVRTRLSELLRADNPELRDDHALCTKALPTQAEVALLMPVQVANFADFYSSRDHAVNVGSMFRDPENPLLPNWVHMPVAYNGRSSSLIVSGQDVRRPMGQTKADDAQAPEYGPSRLVDFELEVGFFAGVGNRLGTQISTAQAPEHIFGMVLVNDWSARDIQKWEYVPLGPFLGKSFATSISPWVVTLDALEPFRVAGPPQDPAVLPYLQTAGNWAYDLQLEAYLQSAQMRAPMRITQTNFRHMYWSIPQQLAHVTVNGTNVLTGDLYASGTVSGPTSESRGCLLELTWRGTEPIQLPSGETRRFLADGDTLIIRGHCAGPGYRVGFGEVRAKILPAIGSS